MSANQNELVRLAKTWIQRDDQFPIDFDEIWEMAGINRRDNAQRHFGSVARNFELIEGLDFTSLKRESTGGRPATTWRMTIGAAKRFLASAQTKQGFAIIDALVKAEEELQAIKANPAILFAEALKPIVDGFNSLAGVVNTLTNVVEGIDKRLANVEERLAGKSIERAVEPKYVMDVLKSSNALTRLRQHYVTCYGQTAGLSAFHRALSSACQEYGFKVDSGRWGLMIEPAAALDSRVVTYIQKSQEVGFESYQKRKGVRNRISPALGQMNFLDN